MLRPTKLRVFLAMSVGFVLRGALCARSSCGASPIPVAWKRARNPLGFLPEPAQHHNSARRIIFGLCAWACAYVAFALLGMLISGARRLLTKRNPRSDAKVTAAPVEWLLIRLTCTLHGT